MTEYHLDLFLF